MLSACVKCDGVSFEMVEGSVQNSNFVYQFIQCNSCGGVVGVVESEYISAMLEIQNRALKTIAARLDVRVEL